MQIEPTAEAFARRYTKGSPQVVWTTLVADLETPVSAFIKVAGARPMSLLLESVEPCGGASPSSDWTPIWYGAPTVRALK
jgi:anthranilate synthase component 1